MTARPYGALRTGSRIRPLRWRSSRTSEGVFPLSCCQHFAMRKAISRTGDAHPYAPSWTLSGGAVAKTSWEHYGGYRCRSARRRHKHPSARHGGIRRGRGASSARIDAGIGADRLGSTNVLYLTLASSNRGTAHLHPHLQRLVYRVLRFSGGGQQIAGNDHLTTHSPHIVSVAPPSCCERHGVVARACRRPLKLPPAVVIGGTLTFVAKGVLLVEGEAERFLLPALAKARR